ncbi:MAG: DinB family protein [Candidatus Dormibacteria bacterium]
MNRAALLEQYRNGPDVMSAAVAGLTDAELDHKPADGGWSPREVVHHTADSEMTSAMRLRRLVAETNPEISGYDGDEFARRLNYATRPIGPSLDAIRAARSSTMSILENLSEEDWGRAGTHSELGAYSVEFWLQIYAVHCDSHVEQIQRAVAEARAA